MSVPIYCIFSKTLVFSSVKLIISLEIQKEISYLDIVLVSGNFRRQSYILNIVKYLSTHISIGILILDQNFKALKKVEQLNKMYLQLCIDNGACLVNEIVSCNLLIIPRFGIEHLSEILERIPKKIKYKKTNILKKKYL